MSFDAFVWSTSHSMKGETEPLAIPGETQDGHYSKVKAFEIISFEIGAENTINIGSTSGGGGAGKAVFKEFTITKKTDSASPGLFTCLVSGAHFDDMHVELRRSGGGTKSDDSQVFLRFDFYLVMVQDISWSGSDGDDVCEETVILQYGAMKITYWPQDAKGARKKEISREWSRILNEATTSVAGA